MAHLIYRRNKQKSKFQKDDLNNSEREFELMFHNGGDPVCINTLDGFILDCNQPFCELVGSGKETIIHQKVENFLIQEQKRKYFNYLIKMHKQETGIFESELISPNGKKVVLEINARQINYQGKRAILAISRNVTERKEIEQKLLQATIAGEERERERFARDIHDDLGPLLSTVKLYLNEIREPDLSAEDHKNYLDYAVELLDDAIMNTRSIANNLMPRVIQDYGLISALEHFIQKLQDVQHVKISLRHQQFNERLPQTVEIIIYRIITELINNSIKHSGSKQIDLILQQAEEQLILHFEDYGKGFVVEQALLPESGYGLKNIISRAKSIAGAMELDSEPGKGCRIRISFPLYSFTSNIENNGTFNF